MKHLLLLVVWENRPQWLACFSSTKLVMLRSCESVNIHLKLRGAGCSRSFSDNTWGHAIKRPLKLTNTPLWVFSYCLCLPGCFSFALTRIVCYLYPSPEPDYLLLCCCKRRKATALWALYVSPCKPVSFEQTFTERRARRKGEKMPQNVVEEKNQYLILLWLQ